MVTRLCEKKCCKATFCPLVIAWARTIHLFQGLQAGPNYPIKKIIADPGSLDFEKINPGIFYTLLSRVSTIGSSARACKDSALYFIGCNMSEHRVTKLCINKDGTRTLTVQKRDAWVAYLNDCVKATKRNKNDMFHDDTVNKTQKLIDEKTNSSYGLSLDDIVQKYIKRLQSPENGFINVRSNHNEWIGNNFGLIKNIIKKKKQINNKIKRLIEETEKDNDDVAEIMENIDTERQGYPIDAMDDWEYDELPTNLLLVAETIEDVPGNGNCGYYAIQKGLLDNKINHQSNITEFRKSIHQHFQETPKEYMYVTSIDESRTADIIWKENEIFEPSCNPEFWFDGGSTIQIISHMFETNCVVYMKSDTPITTASMKMNNRPCFLQKEGYVAADEMCRESQYEITIAIVYVNNNHFMYLKPKHREIIELSS